MTTLSSMVKGTDNNSCFFYVENFKTATIHEYKQMIVMGDIKIDGDLFIEGQLILEP